MRGWVLGMARLRLSVWWVLVAAAVAVVVCEATAALPARETGRVRRNAYATMMYMGTPRDYEFYVAIRVMLRSLSRLGSQADLLVIASMDVPPQWIQTL